MTTVNSPTWKYVEGDIENAGAPTGGFVALCTHMLSGTANWDDIVVRGFDENATGVEDWNIY
jgi:hypothetical protein